MTSQTQPIRPPAVPLIVHDPYFSVWSFTDRLTDSFPRHWTGSGQGMCGMLRIDGKVYRFAGNYSAATPMEQIDLKVWPTRTIYRFAAAGVELTLTFLTPALCDDLDLLSRPITYITLEVRSRDGRPHDVQAHVDVTCEWTVDSPDQKVDAARLKLDNLCALRAGASEQKVLSRSGDNLRIEWGHLYLAAAEEPGSQQMVALPEESRTTFARTGHLPTSDAIIAHRPVTNGWPSLAIAMDFGQVGAKAVSRTFMIAYDDGYAIEYHHRKLSAYWRRNGMDFGQLLKTAWRELPALSRRCQAFDRDLVADLTATGGEKYAALCSLAYRQAIGAHKLVADIDGTPLFFSKENFSNGCIATVDVTYPSAPLFLLLQPKLLEAMVRPILDYAAMPRWKFPFAPHDLGQYPLANGQVYGGGELSERNQMPVEECGNMLILVGALAHVQGNADIAREHWATLSKWAGYLKDKGLDPEEQLCTDDFAGHLGHNTNLAIKAIVALVVYAKLAGMLGEKKVQSQYRRLAESMAKKWQKMAFDGDHYRLAFDRPGTWSQKYNLVWDKLLRLDLFPAEVAKREVAWYLKMQQKYGLPLDSRKTYTKIDWILWSATLANDNGDFRALIEPLHTWLNETPTRVPMTDWYETTDGRQMAFQARSVVGGLFIKLLENPKIWRKWATLARASRTTKHQTTMS